MTVFKLVVHNEGDLFLSTTQVLTALTLTVGDMLVLGQHTSKLRGGTKATRCPKQSFLIHAGGGFLSLILGVFALMFYENGLPVIGNMAGKERRFSKSHACVSFFSVFSFFSFLCFGLHH